MKSYKKEKRKRKKGNANECLRALVNNPFYVSFDIIFMENEKSY